MVASFKDNPLPAFFTFQKNTKHRRKQKQAAVVGQTSSILTMFGLRNKLITYPMRSECPTYYSQSRILYCASDTAVVGPTFNITSQMKSSRFIQTPCP